MTTTTPQLPSPIFRKKVHRDIADGLKGLHQQQVDKGRRYLPNFIIIGAAKSATTTLATILPRHPDIFFPRHKEPKFFGRYYDKGWPWYRKIFRPGRGFPLRGEASTMYSSPLGTFRHAPALMHRYLPEVKIIYVVRHPLDRLVSHWRHRKGRHPRYVSFDRLLTKPSALKRIVGCSCYWARIQEYRRYFPDSQIHCLTFEDLLATPSTVLADLLTFLGTSAQPQLLLEDGRLPRVNEAGEKGRAFVAMPSLPADMRQRLETMLRPDAEAFLSYIGKPTDYWHW